MEWVETALLAAQLVCLICIWSRLDRVLEKIRDTGQALEALQSPEPEREGTLSTAMLEGFDNLMGYSEKTARGQRA